MSRRIAIGSRRGWLRDAWEFVVVAMAGVGAVAAVALMYVAMIVGVLALALAIPALFALVLQFVWGWFARSFGWPTMPFAVAFGCVMLAGVMTGWFRVKIGSKS